MKSILVLILFAYTLAASTNACEDRLFSLSAYDKGHKSLKVSSVLKELSHKCNLSIYFKDKISKKKIEKQLDYINIEDYTLEDFLTFLFHEADLFYTFDKEKNTINVQYLKTKTFNIDYINVSELTSQSSKSINSGSGSSTSNTGGYGNSSGSSSNAMSGGINGGSNSNGGGDSSSNGQTTITTKSEFTFWDNLKNSLRELFPDASKVHIFINRNASLLTITADKQNLEKAEKFLDLLMARMHKQVLIEVKLIGLTYDDSHSSGIDWSKLNLSLSGSIDSASGTLGSSFNKSYSLAYNFSTSNFLKYLDTFGDVKVMSNPKILTMNNQPAVVNVGQQLSYKYQTGSVTTTGGTAAGTNTFSLGSTFIGITLYVIPEITDHNEIVMSINPVVSSLTDEASPTTGVREIPPDTKIKQMTSIVKVKDGQKVLIGGLISVTKGKKENKVALLGSIPILGSLFSYKNDIKKRTEMFVLIIPKIVKSSTMPNFDDIESDTLFSSKYRTKLKSNKAEAQ